MADDTDYAVVVTDAEGTELYNDNVAFDYNEITTLTTDADATINAVVGTNVSVTYTVENEDEDGVEGTDVRVRAIDVNTPAGDVVEEQVLTTDDNGQVTFTYTSIDGRTDNIQAVVLEKPTLRNTAVTVDWVETAAAITVENPAAEGFIVSGATNVADELKTIKYVATFKDENGQPLADDEVVSVDLTGVTGLTAGTNNEFDNNAGSGALTDNSVNTATLANGDGTAVLEFTTSAAQEIEPLFFYSAAGNTTPGTDDPRAKGAKVEVVDGTTQEPTFTLELKEVDEDNGINTDVTEVDGEYNVIDAEDIIFVLTAEDQYGNPFVGTANLDNKVHLDNLAGNDNLPGNIQFAPDEEDGSTFTPATTVDFGADDANGNGVMEVKVNQTSTSVGDTTNLVVWVDLNGNGKYDAGEGVESAKITFVEAEADVLTSMDIEADLTTVVTGNPVTYTVELLDQDGNPFDASASADQFNVVIELYKDGELVATPSELGDDTGLSSGVVSGNGEFKFTVTPAAADAGSEFYPVVYVDVNENGTVELDEKDSAVEGPAFTATALPDSYEIELSATEVVAGETVDVKITALNDDTTPATEVNFNGEHIVKVEILDASATPATLKTYNRTANFVDGVATVTVPVELVDSNKIKVTMPLGTTDNATSVETLTVEALEASGLAVNGSNQLFVADEFGNKVDDYNFEGLATITHNGTFSGDGSLDAENTMVISIVDGDVKEGANVLTFTNGGSDPVTLTMELANGDTFSVTVE